MDATNRRRWVARITPRLGTTVDDLLAMNLGLDVWERQEGSIVVAATDADLVELERRRVGNVERVSTVSDFVARRAAGSADGGETEGGPR